MGRNVSSWSVVRPVPVPRETQPRNLRAGRRRPPMPGRRRSPVVEPGAASAAPPTAAAFFRSRRLEIVELINDDSNALRVPASKRLGKVSPEPCDLRPPHRTAPHRRAQRFIASAGQFLDAGAIPVGSRLPGRIARHGGRRVPRAHFLADVAAVDVCPDRRRERRGDLASELDREVRDAARANRGRRAPRSRASDRPRCTACRCRTDRTRARRPRAAGCR